MKPFLFLCLYAILFDVALSHQISLEENQQQQKEEEEEHMANYFAALNTLLDGNNFPAAQVAATVTKIPAKEKWKLEADNDGRFSVATYNVLADCYCNITFFPQSSAKVLNWKNRSLRLGATIEAIDADIWALQEVDHIDFWIPLMKNLGYGYYYVKRDGKRDGCATFYRKSVFGSMANHELDFDALLGLERENKTRNVALVSVLRHHKTKQTIIVGNAHMYWNPAYEEIKGRQCDAYIHHLVATSQSYPVDEHNFPPIIACGDYNSLPESVGYSVMTGALKSAVMQLKGSEFDVTNYRDTFQGCLDFVFYAGNTIRPVNYRALPPAAELSKKRAPFCPNGNHPSDHWPVAVEMQLR